MLCPVCSNSRKLAFSHKVLSKYDAHFFTCDICGLLSVDTPFWLDEAYSSAIALADTGLLQRNIYISRQLSKIIYLFFNKTAPFIDMAGGYGTLVRMMRDIGFDFNWDDKYAENIFAKGYEADFSKTYEAMTAFEVLEHVADPLQFIRSSLEVAKTRTIVFSTVLFKGPPPAPDSWWYYSFETGQHISFYQRRTLEFIAHKLGLTLFSRKDFHIMTDKPLNPLLFMIATSSMTDRFIQNRIKQSLKSKTMMDHKEMLAKRA